MISLERLEVPRARMLSIAPEYPVTIRPFRLADAEGMYGAAIESIHQLRAWMSWCKPDYMLADAERFILQCSPTWAIGEDHAFAIINAENGAFLGSVGVNRVNFTHMTGNVGYWVRKSATGRGVATAAAQWAVSYAFQQLHLNRLEFLIPISNVPSQRVAQKVGAKFEGILRQRLSLCGKNHDAAIFSLVNDDHKGSAVLSRADDLECA